MKYIHAVMTAAAALSAAAAAARGDVYSTWPNDALSNPNVFPIGVWYQSPNPSYNNEINGYKALGINTFDYLDSSTSTSVLNLIANAGMYAVMDYSPSLASNPTIIAWFNEPDEPDNAQANGSGGYGDPVLPAVQIGQYNNLKSEDSTRPVIEDLGQGVANPYWTGRGSRSGDNQDYPYQTSFKWTNGQTYTQGYLAATDIGAFDFYPENATGAAAGKTSFVAQGVRNMVSWSKPGAPVWNYIETTQINVSSGAPAGPTPAQVKAEVFLSLVNGSNGIMYFADQISPSSSFVEDALLTLPQYAATRREITRIDTQIESLAAVLNSPTVNHGITAKGTTLDVQFMTKVLNNKEYIFTATDEIGQNGTVTFDDPTLAGLTTTMYELLDTGTTQSMSLIGGQFSAAFTTNDAHVYEIPLPVPEPAALALVAVGSLLLLRRRPSQLA